MMKRTISMIMVAPEAIFQRQNAKSVFSRAPNPAG